MYSRIIGTGSYFPSEVRSNADLEIMVELISILRAVWQSVF